MKVGIKASFLEKGGYGRFGDGMYLKLKEHGYSTTLFSMSDTDSVIYTSSREEFKRILLHEKELADSAGVLIEQVHGPWQWPPKDFTEDDRKERMEKMKKSIEATSLLGCKNWVVHPIMPYGTEEFNTENAKKTWDMNITFMSELIRTAKEYGVTVCLENMPMHNFSMAKPNEILKFVKTINDDSFKICLDTGHVSVFDDLNLADEVLRVGDSLRLLHVHDNKFNKDLHLFPRFGVIDWQGFAAALKNIGFDGCFTLETVPPPKVSDVLFEDIGKMLYKIAADIAGDI